MIPSTSPITPNMNERMAPFVIVDAVPYFNYLASLV